MTKPILLAAAALSAALSPAAVAVQKIDRAFTDLSGSRFILATRRSERGLPRHLRAAVRRP